MTPEELDEARVTEAWNQLNDERQDVALIAARLAREGWMPPPPVDPDLLAVREIVAAEWEKTGFRGDADATRRGIVDYTRLVCTALAAYKAGKEAAQ